MAVKIRKTESALQKLAKEELKKKPKLAYLEGSEDEKVWDTYQLSKKLKREFVKLCKKNKINKSAFFRTCIKVLINKDGDLGKTLGEVYHSDTLSE